jgi:hypothetical protein
MLMHWEIPLTVFLIPVVRGNVVKGCEGVEDAVDGRSVGEGQRHVLSDEGELEVKESFSQHVEVNVNVGTGVGVCVCVRLGGWIGIGIGIGGEL